MSAASSRLPVRRHRTPAGIISLVYNEFGQITQDRQAHAGAADAASPRVAYEYENGSANHVRLKKIVYPTTTKFLEPLYGTADQNDVLSRVKQLRFTQSGAVVVADYNYLGLDRPVVVDYPEPDVKLNLASGSGNYPYAGLDQFWTCLMNLRVSGTNAVPEAGAPMVGFDAGCNEGECARRSRVIRSGWNGRHCCGWSATQPRSGGAPIRHCA